MKLNLTRTMASGVSLCSLISLTAFLLGPRDVYSPRAPSPAATQNAQWRDNYGRLPLNFEMNCGQAEATVNFLARGAGYTIALSPNGAAFALASVPPDRREQSDDVGGARPVAMMRMNLVDANLTARVEAENELKGKVNYLIGNDPARWHSDVPTFGRVRYHEVYPGIDLLYYGNQRRLEYDFVVGPGRDVRAIALEFDGLRSLEIEARTGDLLLTVGDEVIRQQKPVAYQEVGGARREVESRYALRDDGRIGFEVGAYDKDAPLVIDPVLVYSTFLGTGIDSAAAIAVDPTGSVYLTGIAISTVFPTASPLQATPGGGIDVFVTKLNSSGTALIYSTYLGGSEDDRGNSIAIDSSGNAYVAGETISTNFPTANAIQATFGGSSSSIGGDAFVAKLNAAGSALVYSTYLGGSANDFGHDVAVDSAGNAYVTGDTRSTNFPTANAFQASSNAGNGEAFVTKINAAGSAFVYSTYLGGTSQDIGYAIAVDSSGNAYVFGQTSSATTFPRVNAIQNIYGGGGDTFVTKINAAGSALVYSTFLGGSSLERITGKSITVDGAGNIYVAGETNSSNFPTANALQASKAANADNFVTKINAAGSALVFSTYLGGSEFDNPEGIALDSAGNIYVVGTTDSPDFPLANAFQTTFSGGFGDAFITKLNPAGSALIYSTYLGASNSGFEFGSGIAVDPAANVYITGKTNSFCFPTTVGAFSNGGGATSVGPFVAKISETLPAGKIARCKGQLLNIATRMRVLTGDSALIGGFIITGNENKRVIIRGIGPSLSGIGVQGALANPTLDLFSSNQTLLASNDDWKSNQAEVEGTTIPPNHDNEAAIVITLAPGAYTAVLRGKNNSSGIGVVEVYDLNADVDAILANISSRGFVDSGDNVMIGGFIIGGKGGDATRVVVRGIGPSLSAFGITGALQDPVIDLKDANGATLLSNDDWQQGASAAEISQLGLAPSDNREAALLTSLFHGSFTAILSGKNDTSGVAVVEVYNLQ